MRRTRAPLAFVLLALAAAPTRARAQAQPPAVSAALATAAPALAAVSPSAPPASTAQPAQSNTARAPATHHHRRRGEAPAREPSLSMGYANSGRLEHGARLESDEIVRYLPGRPLHYGTDELVGLLRRAARTVHRRFHVRLTVGDLSAAEGGPVGHHASHQSGRDADVAFFVLDRRGNDVALEDYLSFGRDGRALAGGPLRFDTEKNWALVEALLDDGTTRVEHIFVSNGLRSLLLAHARAVGASPATLARAQLAMHQPGRGNPHQNHFHVRIACPSGDGACVDGVRYPPRHRRRVDPRGREHHRERAER